MTKVAEVSGEQMEAEVLASLDQYKNLSMFEQYAVFMGKAQILEFGLKGLLAQKVQRLTGRKGALDTWKNQERN